MDLISANLDYRNYLFNPADHHPGLFRCRGKDGIICRRPPPLPGRRLAGIFPCEAELEQLHPARADWGFDYNSVLRGRFLFGRA